MLTIAHTSKRFSELLYRVLITFQPQPVYQYVSSPVKNLHHNVLQIPCRPTVSWHFTDTPPTLHWHFQISLVWLKYNNTDQSKKHIIKCKFLVLYLINDAFVVVSKFFSIGFNYINFVRLFKEEGNQRRIKMKGNAIIWFDSLEIEPMFK